MQISATRLCVILSSQFSNSVQLRALWGGGGWVSPIPTEQLWQNVRLTTQIPRFRSHD